MSQDRARRLATGACWPVDRGFRRAVAQRELNPKYLP